MPENEPHTPAPPIPRFPLTANPSVVILPAEWMRMTEVPGKMPVLSGVYATFTSSCTARPASTGILLPETKLYIRVQSQVPVARFELLIVARATAINAALIDKATALVQVVCEFKAEEISRTAEFHAGLPPRPLEPLPNLVENGMNQIDMQYECWNGHALLGWCRVVHHIQRTVTP